MGGESRRKGSHMPVQTRSRSDKNVVDAKLVRDLAKRQRFYTVCTGIWLPFRLYDAGDAVPRSRGASAVGRSALGGGVFGFASQDVEKWGRKSRSAAPTPQWGEGQTIAAFSRESVPIPLQTV